MLIFGVLELKLLLLIGKLLAFLLVMVLGQVELKLGVEDMLLLGVLVRMLGQITGMALGELLRMPWSGGELLLGDFSSVTDLFLFPTATFFSIFLIFFSKPVLSDFNL